MVRIIQRLDKVKKEMAEFEEHMLGDFKIGTIIGKMRAIVANEEVTFDAGDVISIKIKEIKIPANHICFLCAYAANKYGHTIAVGEEIHLPITMDRHADYASFSTALDGTIEKNDLLGVLILLPIEIIK